MKNIFIIMKHNIKIFLKNPGAIFIFILPLIFTVFLLKASFTGEHKINLMISNADKSGIGEKIISEVLKRDYTISRISPEEINNLIKSGDETFGVIIKSQDLKKDILENKPINIEVVSSDDMSSQIIYQSINSEISNYMALSNISNGNAKEFDSLLSSYEKNKIKVNKKLTINEKGYEELTSNVMGMFVMTSLLAATMGLTLILKEKKIRTYQRICTTRISPGEYILGNALGCYTVLVFQMIAQLILTKLMGIPIPIPYLSLFVVMLITGIFGISVAMLILVFTPSPEAMGSMSGIIITPLTMLSGCFFPIEFFPELLQKIVSVSPIYWIMDAFNKLLQGKGILSVIPSLLIVIAFSAILLTISKIKMQRTNVV